MTLSVSKGVPPPPLLLLLSIQLKVTHYFILIAIFQLNGPPIVGPRGGVKVGMIEQLILFI